MELCVSTGADRRRFAVSDADHGRALAAQLGRELELDRESLELLPALERGATFATITAGAVITITLA